MRRIYVCDTPFQIFNMLNIRYHDDENIHSDIVLVEQFLDYRKITDNIKASNLFENVYECKKVDFGSHRNNIERKLFHLNMLLNPYFSFKHQIKNFSKRILLHYDEIYATYPSPIVLALLVHNRNARLYKVEDGTGSYVLDVWQRGNPIELGIINRYRRKKFDTDISLVNNMDVFGEQDNIRPLPAITNEFISLYFGLMKTYFIEYEQNIIWMTDVINDGKEIERLTKDLIDIFDPYKHTMIVRVHPREKKKEIYDGFFIDKNIALWETLIPRIDIEDKILIGIFSTAQINPKIIFNKEPILIFLYRIENSKIFTEEEKREIDRFVSVIDEKYINKNRIYVPQNYADLIDILNKLMKTN